MDHTKIENCINILTSEDKRRRIQALNDIKNEINNLNSGDQSDELNESIKQLIIKYQRNIIQALNDKVESCREICIEILIDIVKKFVRSVNHDELTETTTSPDKELKKIVDNFEQLSIEDQKIYLNFCLAIINAIQQKFTDDNLLEPSEEVRLKLLHLLMAILKNNDCQLGHVYNDVVSILKSSLVDPYADIKNISCEIIILFAPADPGSFHHQSESLVKPLLTNFNHRHNKVRINAIEAVGSIVQYGNSSSLDDVSTPLAERLFDEHPNVREKVLMVVSNWLLNLRDRYSFLHRLIPLILTSLSDELPQLQFSAFEKWQFIGNEYLKEKKYDSQIKNKMDFLVQDLEHYPEGVLRPNLGCRLLVEREILRIIPAIKNELTSWLPDVRIKSAQLLCTLAQHAEHSIVQHIPNILPIMYRGAMDDEKPVRDNVERAAEMIGYFVPPNVYCSLMLPNFENNCGVEHIRILSAILKGGQRESLKKELENIGKFISQKHICQRRDDLYQMYLLNVVKTLLELCKDDCTNICQELFIVIITAHGLITHELLIEQTKTLMTKLFDHSNFDTFPYMYEKLTSIILEDLLKDSKEWCVTSPSRFIFDTLLSYPNTNGAISSHIDIILQIFTNAVQPTNDANLILKMLILVCQLLENHESALSCVENLQNTLNRMIEDVLKVHLVWRAGKSQEALRTAAVAGIRSCVSISPLSKETISSLVPLLLGTVEDTSSKTRLFSMDCFLLFMTNDNFQKYMTSCDMFNNVYPVILKRLDDENDDVREKSLECVTSLFKEDGIRPDGYDPSNTHLSHVYKTMLIHLDDQNPVFQRKVLESLKKLNREAMLKYIQVEKCRDKEKAQELLEYFEKKTSPST